MAVIVLLSVILGASKAEANELMACPLEAEGPDDILIDFDNPVGLVGKPFGSVPWYANYNVTIPSGMYRVIMTTFDDHASHGGQSQTHEQIYLTFYSSSGGSVLGQTGATNDIPEAANSITTTIAHSLTLSGQTRVLRTVHAAYPNGPKPESVFPVCVLLERLDEPTPPEDGECGSADGRTVSSSPTGTAACRAGTYSYSPPDTDEEYLWSCVGSNGGDTDYCSAYKENDEPDDLEVSCRVDDTSVEVDEEVRFTAEVEGGETPYEYRWDGDTEGEDEDSPTLYVRYDEEGDYEVSVTVYDDNGDHDTASCPVVRVEEEEEDDFEVTCEVSDTSVETDEEVEFTVEIEGGNSPFEYEWDGDIEGEDDDERTLRVEYDDEGRYSVEITVTDDDGRRASDSCPSVKVEDDDDDDDDHDISVTTDNPPSGQLASLDSVFLNQVPPTGFGGGAVKTAWFASFLIIWSAIVGSVFYRRHQKSLRSAEIARFKEINRSR